MRRLVASVVGLWLLPWYALASGGEPATALEHRAATSGLSGTNLFLVNLYNDRRLLFALMVTVMMAVCGMAIAFTVDTLLSSLGLKVTKQGHRE